MKLIPIALLILFTACSLDIDTKLRRRKVKRQQSRQLFRDCNYLYPEQFEEWKFCIKQTGENDDGRQRD